MRKSRWRHSPRVRRLDLHKTLFILPNLFTLASVFCGVTAIHLVASAELTRDRLDRAALLLVLAIFLDLLDGRVARLTRTQSAFGLQLDSLADVISFGVAPAVLVHKWALHQHPTVGLFTMFLFVACGAIRLARFNVISSDPAGQPTRPGKYIVGLPIPPAAGFLVALMVANNACDGPLATKPYAIIPFGVTIGLGLLMVSTVPFRSFKDLKLNAKTAAMALALVVSSVVVWQYYRPQLVLLWLLSVYVTLGLCEAALSLATKIARLSARRSVPPVPRHQ